MFEEDSPKRQSWIGVSYWGSQS